MDSDLEENPLPETEDEILFAEFLEQTPPGILRSIADLYNVQEGVRRGFATPDIQLHCDSEACRGFRFFAYQTSQHTHYTYGPHHLILKYRCRNCRESIKVFALSVESEFTGPNGKVEKLGEKPSFGPPIPSRVISLIGPDRDFFIQGRRSENQGLGLGAFAYYRRVVENQKGRLIGEIAKVAKRLGAEEDDLSIFEKAAKETQFNKAINEIKDVIPRSLLINGHNPLSLLHSALSDGLHARADEECLEFATSIRVVLTELAERISQALKDETELKQAVNKLLQPRNKK